MNNVNDNAVQSCRVNPSNFPNNAKISWVAGNPLINFVIGAKPMKIRAGSLRLNGKLTCYKPDSTDKLLSGDAVSFDSSTGVHGLIESLTIANSQNHTYETIKSYNRMMASYAKQSVSNNDLNTIGSMSGIQTGQYWSGTSQLVTNTLSFSIPLYSGLIIGNNY